MRPIAIRLLLLVLVTPILSRAQELLFTTDGRNFNPESYRINDDGSMLEVRTCATCLTSIPVDSVAELVSFNDEKIYHLKRLLIPTLKVAFLELITSGQVTVYRRTSHLREKGSFGQLPRRPAASPGYTPVEQYFLEKDGFLKQILPAYGGSPLQQGLLLKEFVNDDVESVREIDNVNFKLVPTSLLQVVEDYNARVFKYREVDEAVGRVSFILVDDRQENAPLTVMVNGETSPMTDQAVTFQIPVSADSKVCITNGAYSKCQVVRGTRHFPIFLEVRIEKSGQEIQFKKLHSKRFSHVARRVSGGGGR